jgi:exopolysaccharide production protein ExoZ
MARLLTLQIMRGVAANLVVLSHLSIVEAKYTDAQTLPTFSFYGIAGVDIFFVLSGFIMVVVAGKGIGAIEFLWRRAARIYPAYWLVSLVVLATSLVEPTRVNSSIQGPISLWRSFLLVPDSTLPLLAVGWTLIHEVYFYLVFAIFLALRIPILVGLLGWGFVLLALKILGGDYAASFPLMRVWTNPLTAEFMMGAVIGVVYDHKNMRGAAWAGAAGLATLAASIVFVAPAVKLANSVYLDAWRVMLFGMPAALIIYWLVALEQKTVQMPARLLVALGDWSYATYLTHVLVLSAIGRIIYALALPGAMSSAALIVVGFLAVNLVGAFVFRFFERPALALLRRVRLNRAGAVRAHGSKASHLPT